MKPVVQIAACATALAALLFSAASQATDVAQLPLKASVLAQPNVILGMDDSGSMDWEVLFQSTNGGVWWQSSGTNSAWDSGTNRPRTSSNNNQLSYLFPMGTATGGQIYGTDSAYGRALPPTPQFAWARSSAFNPLYYDPRVTYKPWAPAYVDGALRSYTNASPTAAPSHPAVSGAQTLNLTADWTDSGNANFSSTNFAFRVYTGMTIPAGSRVYAASATADVCSGSTVRTLTSDVVAGTSCRTGISYFPATYWQRTQCPAGDNACVAVPDCTLDANSCINSPDGVGKLRRYEVKSGNSFPTGRSYSAEIQNFANWFTYHRKRKLLMAGAMGRTLEPITGLRLGVVPFGSTSSVTMYESNAANASSNRFRVAGAFYTVATGSGEGTPTHQTMKHIAGQFDTNTSVVQYACQRNSMFVLTDGFANSHSQTVPSYDRSTYGSGAPYATTESNSLADFALYAYTYRLRASGGSALAAARVPSGNPARTNPDLNTNLHVTTYAVTLGARGSLYPTALNPFDVDVFASPPTWPTPVADSPTMIDDLWHATINGRGQMYLANDVESMGSALQSAFRDILSQTGAQGGIAVSTVNLPRGDNKAYFGTYNPSGWAGDLTANPINAATGAVSNTALWSAASLLGARDWNTRVIASASASGGVAFTAANVAATVNPGAVYGGDSAVINYLRGDRSGEGTDFRTRTSLMGAVINSEPVVSRDEGVVYVQSSEGMLHAFDTQGADAGKELWAFVPRSVLSQIGASVERAWAFGTRLDGAVVVGKVDGNQKLLVAGTGVAGRSFHALDVTTPRGLTEGQLAAKVKWEFPAAGDSATQAKVGLALGRPVIVKSQNNGHVVLISSGYNNTADGKGRLWMLNASTGAVIQEFTVAAGTLADESGLTHVAAFAEDDGTVRYAYGGDLLGNVWRFDLTDKGAPTLVAVLKGPAGDPQPVTTTPELINKDGKRVILVGTGRLLDIVDFGNAKVQTMYAIVDGATLGNARSSLKAQVYNAATDKVTGPAVNWASDRGWYLDLPAGQQANTRPTIAYGAVAFVTNTNGGSDCTASSRLYVLDVSTGGAFPGIAYVSTVISDVANSSGVTALLTSNGKIVGSGQDADGKPWERTIYDAKPITPGKNAWREVRRP